MEQIAGSEEKVWHSNRAQGATTREPVPVGGTAYQRLMARRKR
jgi:hypothetical protein